MNEIKERMCKLEERTRVIERKEGEETGEKRETEKEQEIKSRITAIEKMLKRKKREERRRNIIKGINWNEKEKKKVVERILEKNRWKGGNGEHKQSNRKE